MSIKNIEQMGFNDFATPLKMKGLLYNSLCRSKLTYGMETIDLNEAELKNLKTFEGNILKRANELSTRSRTTALTYAMGISTFEAMIYKRKIGFILQLINNDLTIQLIQRHECTTIAETLFQIGYEFENENALINVTELKILCRETLKRINEIEETLFSHPLTNSVRRLLDDYNVDNHDTAQFLLDPRRIWYEN